MYPDSHPHGYGRSVEIENGGMAITHDKHINISLLHHLSHVKSMPTCVDDFVDDLCDLAFKKRVEQFDQKQQTGAEDGQRACEEDQTHGEV